MVALETVDAAIQALGAAKTEEFKTLLDAEPRLADERDRQGVSLLMQAIYRQQPGIVALLLERGAPIDAFAAAALGDAPTLRTRLAATPSLIGEFSPDGFTLLHLAAFFGHADVVQELLSCGALPSAVSRNPMQVQPLHSAAALRQRAAAQLLLAAGADVHARQQGGWTPLHAAASGGDMALTELLLEHGADPRLQNDQGLDAFALARSKGHDEVLALLARRTPA